jgi:hypothetical protein
MSRNTTSHCNHASQRANAKIAKTAKQYYATETCSSRNRVRPELCGAAETKRARESSTSLHMSRNTTSHCNHASQRSTAKIAKTAKQYYATENTLFEKSRATRTVRSGRSKASARIKHEPTGSRLLRSVPFRRARTLGLTGLFSRGGHPALPNSHQQNRAPNRFGDRAERGLVASGSRTNHGQDQSHA